MLDEKNFYNASDVAKIMGVSVSTAYKIIRKLNCELQGRGCITVAGRVNRDFFKTKTMNGS